LPKAPPFKPAPGLGEHTMEILKGLGISQEEAAQLKKEGVV
jgi:crotonobetainyl-CoA:carnitine CoA-transferase CaiB-like acyl-CoA transferase